MKIWCKIQVIISLPYTNKTGLNPLIYDAINNYYSSDKFALGFIKFRPYPNNNYLQTPHLARP